MRQWMESLLRWEVPLFFIVLLRLAVGFEFISQGHDKIRQEKEVQLSNPEKAKQGYSLELTLTMWMEEERTISYGGDPSQMARKVRMFVWYRRFLEMGVLPNVRVFSMLVTVAEIALGAMLVLGLLVRVASVLGIVLCLNYLLATWHLGFPYTGLNVLVLVALLIFVLVSAGRCLGIDALLRERFPEIPLL